MKQRNGFVARRKLLLVLWPLLFCIMLYMSTFTWVKAEETSDDLAPVERTHEKRLLANAFAEKPIQQEFKTTNIILMVTIDGSLHCVRRDTGSILWTKERVAGGPLVREQATQKEEDEQESDAVSDESESENALSNEVEEPIDSVHEEIDDKPDGDEGVEEFKFMVEPINQGRLYLYSHRTGLQKFPWTIQSMVDASPRRSETGQVFVGSKKSKLFAIDPRSGAILKYVDSEGGTCRASASDVLPPDTLYIGKNEYKLTIHNRGSTKPAVDVAFNEFVPSTLDNEPELNYQPPHYIASSPDGEVRATDVASGMVVWTLKLPSPAMTIFNVIRGEDSSGSLYVVRQPKVPISENDNRDPLLSTHIGFIEGAYFAMSSDNYPMVQLGNWAKVSPPPVSDYQVYAVDGTDDDSEESCYSKAARYPECLVGKHAINQRLLSSSSENQDKAVPKEDAPSSGSPNETQYNKFYVALSLLTVITLLWGTWTQYGGQKLRKKYLFPKDMKKGTPNKKKRKSSTTNKKVSFELAENEDPDLSMLTENVSPTTAVRTSIVNDSSNGKISPKDTETIFEVKLSKLVVSEDVGIGWGSHGTIVYKGTFGGREVAVKRLLTDFYDVVEREVSLLEKHDFHPNVIRYHCMERSEKFYYIALELCDASLYEVIERRAATQNPELLTAFASVKSQTLLYQIISGLNYLHEMKIVHRDIKPQNILIALAKGGNTPIQAKISDFGLSKKIEGTGSSLPGTSSGGGTIGWRAPELLPQSTIDNYTSDSFSSSYADEGSDEQPRRFTRAIDIFSAGCLFYYVLSNGGHPFGNIISREANILNNTYRIENLEPEAKDLIERMISKDPSKRPKAGNIIIHPYFWSPTRRLAFLQDASDRFEKEGRDPPSELLKRLEFGARAITGSDWHFLLDGVIKENLRKHRSYDGTKIRDLLRALRNKKNHYQDDDEKVKRALGDLPDGFLNYFTSRFPRLLLHVYNTVAENDNLRNESVFRQYFSSEERNS